VGTDIFGSSALVVGFVDTETTATAHLAQTLLAPIETINHFIEADEPGYPAGYATIHILASGVDQSFLRTMIMEQLIEKKADIEARTLKHSHNTAATLAAPQGAGNMWKVLMNAGADITTTNSNGLGQLQDGRQCSTQVKNSTASFI